MITCRVLEIRRKLLIWVSTALVLASLSASMMGCGARPTGGDGQSQPGAPVVLWSWPSQEELGRIKGSWVAVFRFESPPKPGSLSVEVRPAAPFILGYAGQVVTVTVEGAAGSSYEVTLKNQDGTVLGKACVGSPQASDLPLLRVFERRQYRYPAGATAADVWNLAFAPRDGDTVKAGFGEVVIEIRVPALVTEKALRDAVIVDPAEGAEIAFTHEGEASNLLTVRWPGVAVMEPSFPDPACVLRSGEAPRGFALTMRVAVDSQKVAAFRGMTGRDGIFDVTVTRVPCAECTIRSLDEPRVCLPFGGFRTVYSVKTGPHRFLLTFSKPVDRASVERALVLGLGWTLPDVPTWSFEWKSDDALECVLALPRSSPTGHVRLSLTPGLARDCDGLPLSLWPDDALIVRFCEPMALARVAADDLSGSPQKVADVPPGVIHLIASPHSACVLGLEEAMIPSDDHQFYHPWVYSIETQIWTDLGPVVWPFTHVRWLDGQRLIAKREDGWDVIDARTGDTIAEWRSGGPSLLGVCPSPDGTRIAALVGTRNPHERSPADLVIFDREGNVLKTWPGLTATDGRDFYIQDLPLVWTALPDTPDGDIFLVDRRPDGGTRILRVNVKSGEVLPVPGSERATRRGGGLLAAFGQNPALVAFVSEAPDGWAPNFKLVDLDKGVELTSKLIPEIVPDLTALLPSPDGRFVAVAREVLDVSSASRPGEAKWSRLPGSVAGWSPDGKWLYLYGQFEAR